MEKVTNVLLECYMNIPSFELTVQDFQRHSSVIPINVRSKLTRNITPADISWCDVLVSVRGGNPLSAYLVKEAKKAGRKVALMIDDDLLLNKPSEETYANRSYKKALLDVLNNADCMITPSKYLGEKYKKKFGINYVLVDTVVDSGQFVRRSLNIKDGKIRLLYAAGQQHKVFFEKFVSPILNKLYDCYGERVSLTIVGPDVDLSGIQMKCHKIASMPMGKYRDFMNNNSFDIGLAPLFDNEFCKSKYFNKYIEYSVNSICGIYSNVIPYSLVVENEYDGFLVENNPDSWFKTICKAIDNSESRIKCVINAQQKLMKDFNADIVAKRLLNDTTNILDFKADPCKRKYAKHMFLRFIYYVLERRTIGALVDLKNKYNYIYS